MDRESLLSTLQDQLTANGEPFLMAHRIENGNRLVFGEGDPAAKIMFIGEAPGALEAATGRPFVGRAGKTLNELLDSIGLARERVYITNIVKDRPPQNRAPLKREIEFYVPYLLRQVNIIQPNLIVTLGRFSMTFILDAYDREEKHQPIGELHGSLIPLHAEFGPTALLPLYHPAATFYNHKLVPAVQQDFQKIIGFV